MHVEERDWSMEISGKYGKNWVVLKFGWFFVLMRFWPLFVSDLNVSRISFANAEMARNPVYVFIACVVFKCDISFVWPTTKNMVLVIFWEAIPVTTNLTIWNKNNISRIYFPNRFWTKIGPKLCQNIFCLCSILLNGQKIRHRGIKIEE